MPCVYAKMYMLRPEMARELKDTNNRICQNAPAGLSGTKCIITVGDVCTIKIYEQARMPDLSIIDFKTKRNIPLSLEEKNIMDQIGGKSLMSIIMPELFQMNCGMLLRLQFRIM